jgi:hypothetical protein
MEDFSFSVSQFQYRLEPKEPKLVYLLETDKSLYGPEETVSITFKARNKDAAKAKISFASGQQFDVIIKNNEGEDVWQLSLHMSYSQSETSITINPGKTKTFDTQWDQRDDNGELVSLGPYTVQAFLTTASSKYGKTAMTHIGIRTLPTFKNCQELKEKLEELAGSKRPDSPPSTAPRPINFPWIFSLTNPPWTPLPPGPSWILWSPIHIFSDSIIYPYLRINGTYFSNPVLPEIPERAWAGTPSSSGVPYFYGPGGKILTPPLPYSGTGSRSSEIEFSTTNTQVAGVDEGDIVKNDGFYIYMIKGRSVRIIKAFPPEELKELPKTDFENEKFIPNQLYVDGNTLVVIGKEYRNLSCHYYEGVSHLEEILHCHYPGASYTRIFIYDMTNRASIILERMIKIEARYLQSRKVDDFLYIVMNADPPYRLLDEDVGDPSVLLPFYNDSSKHSEDEGEAFVDCDEIAFFPGYTEPNYLVIAAIPVKDPTMEIGRELILGKSENVYCSTKNLYVTSTSFIDEDFPPASPENTSIWIPSIFRNSENTMVYKFTFDEGSVNFTGKAKVPGTIINQFSMDEYDHHFRIATTTELLSSGNNLFILDENMKLTGLIEDIARYEHIKSVRFMGEKAYVVTFRETDPFFVISLDHTHPEILGELKIPGYTEYLHPYDQNLMIGFGREVENNMELGMKISLFDVTDAYNPIELDKEVIGQERTDSELLDDHKALLFIKPKNLMAFPITVTEHAGGSPYNYNYIFQGAYFYFINESGFERKGEITHCNNITFPTKYSYHGEDSIRRIIYIADHCYTISESKIKAVGMLDFSEDNIIILE